MSRIRQLVLVFTDRSLGYALLFAKVDVIWEFFMQIQTVDMLGFPIVPNMSAMWEGNPEECNSNKCDLSVLFYSICA